MKVINKHYIVEHTGERGGYKENFNSITKAKQIYNKIKLHSNEIKILRFGNCILYEDSYFNNIWVHKEKGV